MQSLYARYSCMCLAGCWHCYIVVYSNLQKYCVYFAHLQQCIEVVLRRALVEIEDLELVWEELAALIAAVTGGVPAVDVCATEGAFLTLNRYFAFIVLSLKLELDAADYWF